VAVLTEDGADEGLAVFLAQDNNKERIRMIENKGYFNAVFYYYVFNYCTSL
jgi:hypothetical protein